VTVLLYCLFVRSVLGFSGAFLSNSKCGCVGRAYYCFNSAELSGFNTQVERAINQAMLSPQILS
jgi:hypothetical protein